MSLTLPRARPATSSDRKCIACGGRTHAGEEVSIAGVTLHLRCAVYRRRALRRGSRRRAGG
jgi:hypothetical protein